MITLKIVPLPKLTGWIQAGIRLDSGWNQAGYIFLAFFEWLVSGWLHFYGAGNGLATSLPQIWGWIQAGIRLSTGWLHLNFEIWGWFQADYIQTWFFVSKLGLSRGWLHQAFERGGWIQAGYILT